MKDLKLRKQLNEAEAEVRRRERNIDPLLDSDTCDALLALFEAIRELDLRITTIEQDRRCG